MFSNYALPKHCFVESCLQSIRGYYTEVRGVSRSVMSIMTRRKTQYIRVLAMQT